MTPKEKETDKENSVGNEPKKPWQWGDESENPDNRLGEKPKTGEDIHTYTSVTELLEDEIKEDLERLEVFFKKYSKDKTPR